MCVAVRRRRDRGNRNGVETSVELCYCRAVLVEHVLTNKNTIQRLSMPVESGLRKRDKSSSVLLLVSGQKRQSRRVLVIADD